MAVPGDAYPSPSAPVWTHQLLRGLDASPVQPKLAPVLARLAERGWTDDDMNDYLARVERVTGTYHAIVAAGFCTEQLPGIPPAQVAGWVLFFHEPAYAVDAQTPTEALYFWMDDDCPVSIREFARAARGDYELALLALTANITLAELTQRVAAGTVDREALRMRAAGQR
jgi:hypothetical protein